MKQRIELMEKIKATGTIYHVLQLNIYPEGFNANLPYSKYQSTLKIIFGSFKNPLPIHTLHYYVKNLKNKLFEYKLLNKIKLSPLASIFDLLCNLLQMEKIIESYLTKDYWKKPEIKQPILVKLSKSDFNAIYK